ncbi:MAG: hypothetical protein IJT91_03120 [Clostridia bacterium]|nr:hypothetical protein [Clostridia bacterium]
MITDKSDIDICRGNIVRLTSVRAERSEALEYHLRTAAKIICSGTKTIGDPERDTAGIRSNFALLSEGTAGIPVGIHIYAAEILFDGGIYSVAEKLYPRSLPDPATAVYLKNTAADKAFDEFSKNIPELTFSYAGGFSEACEDVYDSRADAVILPCGGDPHGMSERTRSLVNTYGLKIIRRCAVPAADGENLYFALCASDVYLDKNRLDRELELSVSFGGEGVLRRSLELCGLIGAELICIRSDSRSGGDISASFRCRPGGVSALICFFAVEADHFDINGLINI